MIRPTGTNPGEASTTHREQIMKKTILAALVLALAPARGAAAQSGPHRLAVEVSGGAAIPTHAFGAEDGADTGARFAASAVYSFATGVAGYAGYSQSRMACDNSFCGSGRYEGSGVNAGAELSLPRGRVARVVYPWVRGGIALHTLSHNAHEGAETVRVTSDRAVGYEVGAGIALPLANRITFRPGVGYTSFRAEFDEGGLGDATARSMRVRMVAAGLSLRVSL